MVKMNGVDLRQFQFDFDLTWSALFLHPDGTVFARYGSRTVEGAMVSNSAAGLTATMRRVLEAYQGYPANRGRFESKRGSPPRFERPEDFPYLANRRRARRVNRGNCIHCHNVHEAFHDFEIDRKGRPERVYKYPHPENIGLRIAKDSGIEVSAVLADSPASRARLNTGDVLQAVNGQAILSIADLQFALHNLGEKEELVLEVRRDDQRLEKKLRLEGDWRRNDFSWRVSLNGFPPSPGLYLRLLEKSEKRELGIARDGLALEVKGLFSRQVQRSGLEEGDVIIKVDGKTDKLSSQQFKDYLRVHHYLPGTPARLEVFRDGKVRRLEAKFFESSPRSAVQGRERKGPN